jgi:hypothetical protein
MAHNRAIIVSMGVILAALFILFPEWIAVQPNNPSLTVSLGHAWLFSPPPPPKGFEMMRVERTSLGYLLAMIVLIATGFFYWLEGRRGNLAGRD